MTLGEFLLDGQRDCFSRRSRLTEERNGLLVLQLLHNQPPRTQSVIHNASRMAYHAAIVEIFQAVSKPSGRNAI